MLKLNQCTQLQKIVREDKAIKTMQYEGHRGTAENRQKTRMSGGCGPLQHDVRATGVLKRRTQTENNQTREKLKSGIPKRQTNAKRDKLKAETIIGTNKPLGEGKGGHKGNCPHPALVRDLTEDSDACKILNQKPYP